MVQVVYEELARQHKKDNSACLAYLDRQCLNYGQNWEDGFIHGLTTSRVIVLLVSFKVVNSCKLIYINIIFIGIGRDQTKSIVNTR